LRMRLAQDQQGRWPIWPCIATLIWWKSLRFWDI